MTQSLTQLFNDKRLRGIIDNIVPLKERDDIRSELFLILVENNKVEKMKTYNEQIWHCIRIIKNTLGVNSSYHKEFRNSGATKKFTRLRLIEPGEFDEARRGEVINTTSCLQPQLEPEETKWEIIIRRIDGILNEIPWYEAHLFRLYYLPFRDANCDVRTYSMRDIEKMHTCGNYKIDHVAIYHKLKKTFTHILKKLKVEGLLKESDIKNLRTKNIFKLIN